MQQMLMIFSNLINATAIFFILSPLISLSLALLRSDEKLPLNNPEARLYAAISAALILVAIHFLNRIGILERISLLCQGARPASQRELARLDPIIQKVKSKIDLPDLRLAISDSGDANAWALGRRTISINRGLLDGEFTENEIEAIVGHEFGHLIYKDSYYSTPVSFMRIITEAVLNFASRLYELLHNVMTLGIRFHPLSIIILGPVLLIGLAIYLSIIASTVPFMFIDQRLIPYLELKLTRDHEFRADEMGAKLSSPQAMLSALEKIDKKTRAETKTFWQRLLDTHPPIAYRIDRLDTLCRNSPVA